jgi:hypothetical protein
MIDGAFAIGGTAAQSTGKKKRGKAPLLKRTQLVLSGHKTTAIFTPWFSHPDIIKIPN